MTTTIFPSIIPDEETYDEFELHDAVAAATLQGIAAAHPTDDVNGQSTALEIASFLAAHHTGSEIDGMVAIIEDAEPPRSECDLSPAINGDGNLSMY